MILLVKLAISRISLISKRVFTLWPRTLLKFKINSIKQSSMRWLGIRDTSFQAPKWMVVLGNLLLDVLGVWYCLSKTFYVQHVPQVSTRIWCRILSTDLCLHGWRTGSLNIANIELEERQEDDQAIQKEWSGLSILAGRKDHRSTGWYRGKIGREARG